MTGQNTFSMRWLGVFKFAVCVLVWLFFTIEWWRRGPPALVFANGLLFPLLLCDPANTIYLSTFYAEFTAVVTLYLIASAILVYHEQPKSTHAMVLLALAAFALGMSKIQHLLLPMICAATVLIFDYVKTHRSSWRAISLFVGAIAALLVQVMQLHRDNAAMRDIDMFNHADVAFTGLLPNASDAEKTADLLGLDRACIQYSGLRAWQMPGYPPQVCPDHRECFARTRIERVAARSGDGHATVRGRHRGAESLARAGTRNGRRRPFRSAAAVVVHGQRFVRGIGNRPRASCSAGRSWRCSFCCSRGAALPACGASPC